MIALARQSAPADFGGINFHHSYEDAADQHHKPCHQENLRGSISPCRFLGSDFSEGGAACLCSESSPRWEFTVPAGNQCEPRSHTERDRAGVRCFRSVHGRAPRNDLIITENTQSCFIMNSMRSPFCLLIAIVFLSGCATGRSPETSATPTVSGYISVGAVKKF